MGSELPLDPALLEISEFPEKRTNHTDTASVDTGSASSFISVNVEDEANKINFSFAQENVEDFLARLKKQGNLGTEGRILQCHFSSIKPINTEMLKDYFQSGSVAEKALGSNAGGMSTFLESLAVDLFVKKFEATNVKLELEVEHNNPPPVPRTPNRFQL